MNNTPQEEGLWQRIKESPRTVSALIIILIVAAAIYAFSGPRQESVPTATETPVGPASGQATVSPKPGSPTEAATPKAAQPTPMPEASRTDQAFVEVAQRGEGATHLARRAAGRWLQENQAGYEVTAEHKIYIEDYIKDRIGRKGLSLGQEQEISYQLVAEAVAAAKELNERQLKNLTKYTKYVK